jgi:hypothetical protein
MALIRAFETQVAALYRDGDIPGFVHTSLGQEAVAAGVCGALQRDDYLTTTHRGHGHVLAKGADVDGMMAELFGRATGLSGGKADRCTSPTRRWGSSAPTRSSAPASRSRPVRRCRASSWARAASRSPSSAKAPSTRARSTRRSTLPRSGTSP